MGHERAPLWTNTRHQHSLLSHVELATHLASARGPTNHGLLCLPSPLSSRSHRPLHIYGSRTTLVGWAELQDPCSSPSPKRQTAQDEKTKQCWETRLNI